MSGYNQTRIDHYEIYFNKELQVNPEICLRFIEKNFLKTESETIDQYFLDKMSAIKEVYCARGDLESVLECSKKEYMMAQEPFEDKDQEAAYKKKPSKWLFDKATELKKNNKLLDALNLYKLAMAFDDEYLYAEQDDIESQSRASGFLSEVIGELQFEIVCTEKDISKEDITQLTQNYHCSTTNQLRSNGP